MTPAQVQYPYFLYKKYRVRSVPMIHSTPPQSVLNRDTFTIDYTDDEVLYKEAVFKNKSE